MSEEATKTKEFNVKKIFLKITSLRNAESLLDLNPSINDNITTTEIDEIIAFKAADKIIQHSDYSLLGGRILLSRQSKLIGKELPCWVTSPLIASLETNFPL